MGSADLGALGRILNRQGLDYALIGGHAVNVWVEPRFTADVDIVVVAGPDDFDRLKQGLAAEGFAVALEHGGDQPSGADFIRFTAESNPLVLEVQAAKTELQREIVRRARPRPGGLPVATVEDLIVLKLIADRAKDQVDLFGLAKLPRIDWPYVEQWSTEWQVLDRLKRLRATSGES